MMRKCTILLISFLLLAARYASAYKILHVDNDENKPELHWSDVPVNYLINEVGTPDCAGETQAIRDAFQTWENVPSSYISFYFQGTTSQTGTGNDGVNLCIWVESGWSFSSSAIAVARIFYSTEDGHITDCDISFNGETYTWSTTGETDKYDVQAIATHEIGHLCGLGDLYFSWDSEKTMYGYASAGETKKRTLDSDDEAGVTHIYPMLSAPVIDLLPLYNNSGNYKVSWSSVSNTDYYKLQEDTNPFFASPTSETLTLTYKDFSAKKDGIYFYRVQAHSETKGYSDYSNGRLIVVDKTPPTSGTILINNGNTYTNNLVVTLNLSAVDTFTGINTVGISNYSNFSSCETYVSEPDSYTYTNTIAWTLSPPGDGSHTVYAGFMDVAGNTSSISSDTIILDRTAPTTVTFALSDWADTKSIILDWNDSTDTVSGLWKYVVSRSSTLTGTYNEIFTTNDTTVTTYTDTNALDGQTWFYKVQTYDRANNYSTSSIDSTTIDMSTPNTPTLTFPGNNGKLNDTTPTFTWTVPDTGSPLTYRLEISETEVFSPITLTNTVTNPYYTLVNTEALSIWKTYYWRVFVRDLFRYGPVSLVYNFSIDTYPPIVNMTSPVNGLITTTCTQSLTGNISDSGPINTAILILNGIEQVINVDTGSFSESIVLKKGFNYIQVKSYDEYGNLGISSLVSVNYITILSNTIYPSTSDTTVSCSYTKLVILQGTFSDTVMIGITEAPVYDTVTNANNSAASDPALRLVNELGSTVRELNAFKVTGGTTSCTQVLTGNFNKSVILSIKYPASISNPLIEENLRIYSLDLNTQKWVIVSGGQTLDRTVKTVSVDVNHFSIYRLMSLSFASSDLSNVIVFPNPFNPNTAVGGTLKFMNLTQKATIKIYTLAGELVRVIEKNDSGDRATWGGKNVYGESVANGLYIYVVSSEGSTQKAVGKIAVIK